MWSPGHWNSIFFQYFGFSKVIPTTYYHSPPHTCTLDWAARQTLRPQKSPMYYQPPPHPSKAYLSGNVFPYILLQLLSRFILLWFFLRCCQHLTLYNAKFRHSVLRNYDTAWIGTKIRTDIDQKGIPRNTTVGTGRVSRYLLRQWDYISRPLQRA